MKAQSFATFQKKQIISVLKRTGGNRSDAAKLLGVSVRTVRNWIKKYQLISRFPPRYGRQK